MERIRLEQGKLLEMLGYFLKAGDEVSVTIEPAERHRLKASSLKANDTVIEGNKFVMPKEDVVVTAEFEEVGGGDVDPEAARVSVMEIMERLQQNR